jgi:UDP-N-acetylglucosamine/UDP-N-acetylgalactosamine 4-epimerase
MNNRKLYQSKVLVTGGAGFIGSNLVDRLLSQNNIVICLDNFSTGRIENLEYAVKHQNFRLIEGDITNYSDCRQAIEDCDYVIHLAALGNVPLSIVNPVTTTNVNIIGFVNILTASVEAKIKRFIYASSSSVYGNSSFLPKIEYQTGKVMSPLAVSKLANEIFAENFSNIYGIETIGLRYFNVYGYRQTQDGEFASVIPRFVNALINYKNPVIYGDGSNSRDFTYIDDVIKATELAIIVSTNEIRQKQHYYYNENRIHTAYEENDTLCEIFNIAYGTRTRLITLAQLIRDKLSCFDPLIKEIDFLFSNERHGDTPHSLASIEKAKSILGFFPDYPLNSGIELTSEWYFENFNVTENLNI